jgi:hypothetical protein
MSAKIGLIVPANNSVIEPEFWAVLPPGVAVYATRILARGNLTPDAVRRMETQVDRAVEELAATGVDVIAYADMVTTFIMEKGWNEEKVAQIAKHAGVGCVSAWTSLRDALTALGVRRFALGTPYPAAIHATARPFFEAQGFDVVGDARCAEGGRRCTGPVRRVLAESQRRRGRVAGNRPADFRQPGKAGEGLRLPCGHVQPGDPVGLAQDCRCEGPGWESWKANGVLKPC